ncbi:MAG: YybH family protein [Candidatus Acidiferrales bacterium]
MIRKNVLRVCAVALMTLALGYSGATADTNGTNGEIADLMTRYFGSIDRADTAAAEHIFAPDATFIHPRGEDRGRAQIEADLYRKLMGETFSQRTLTAKGISVHVYGDCAWAEFNWDFVAKVRKDGSAFHSQGRETDIFQRENGKWRIIHVHYSGAPVTGNLKGF